MKKGLYQFVVLCFSVLLLGACQSEQSKEVKEVKVFSKFEDLEAYYQPKNDKVKVINFWATWCKPCIKELPHFNALVDTHADDVDLLLVSLDFADQIDNKLLPFMERKGIKAEVVLLDDPAMNKWINEVSEEWTGGIPATLILKGDQQYFFEKEFSKEELEQTLSEIIQ
ncbi:TlpA family protein disulfide reductase [Sediminitomix flava]|uniref:AhpC/TSA family protein n=1 Tax=Sediminitomix flava TaxID=379075 RepID=A0A316A070_SEDFL|nr:TlpA disulfide reductase family protein [Sediminitomix flava]PWJ43037.1 AhpC/TSA family protein [Sediminitomix flava]